MQTPPQRTGRASEVRINDFVGVRIQVDEHFQDKLPSGYRVSRRA